MDTDKFIKQVEDFYSLNTNGEKLDSIKKAYTIKNEDGSTLVEWAFVKFRIGFSFELPKDDSFFYIVANKELKSLQHSETFKTESELESAIKTAVTYIIENKDR